jgi:hypothetical protein
MLAAIGFGMNGIVGMGRVFARLLVVRIMAVVVVPVLFMGMFFMRMIFMDFGTCRRGSRGLDRHRNRHVRRRSKGRCLVRVGMVVLVMRVVMPMIVTVVMIMRMLTIVMIFMIGMVMMFAIGVVMAGIVRVAVIAVQAFAVQAFGMLERRGGLRRIESGVVEDLALDPFATAAAARIAVTGTAVAAGAVFAFFLGFAMGALVRLDQGLTIGDRNLIIIWMDFAEGEKAVTVAAIFDEGGLKGRFYARDLGEVDVAAQLFALGGLEIKLFDTIAADHNDPGLFQVGGVDQHFVGHFGTLDGGGRVYRCAHMARPGDATVHLIRG